ncbi:MAG: cytochrome b/b6 domain-containing protein [Gammaproteobacteria bacterium]|nr:MAG: cytochrome b/b6 domain-containing protein [Gammaproteobacteria bacterium]
MHAPDELGTTSRLIHLGMVIFGISAWLTGELAEVEEGSRFGYDLHSWLGIGLTVFILLRIITGLIGPANVRFSQWVPLTRERLGQVVDDTRALLILRLPDRPLHYGLSGLVQFLGLLVFTLMALTGSILFVMLEPETEAEGLLHLVEELHETGELLIPLYLAIHVGAVVLHALAGRHKWRRMFFIKG